MAKNHTKHIFLLDMRVGEWTRARNVFIFLSGSGPRPVSGNADETRVETAHMPAGL